MLIYFLGGESEFTKKICARSVETQSDFLFFSKIGSFVKAAKIKSPQMVFAQLDFWGTGFDLKKFLFEQEIQAPIFFFDSLDGRCAPLQKLKADCKIPDKLFELFKFLYYSKKSKSLSDIQEHFSNETFAWSPNSVRVSLCRLKKLLSSQNYCDIELIKEGDGYRLAVFNKAGALTDQLVQVGVEL